MSVDQKIRIGLTGNPFVDTGLGVIAALADLDDIRDLTLYTIFDVYQDGEDLARWNARLKSFTQVFGTNNPLFQSGYGYKKGKGPSELNYAIYRSTLKEFLKAIAVDSAGPRCQACGTPTSFNFSESCVAAVAANPRMEADKKKQTGGPAEKWLGRDWFPLAGSVGSDAQALPAASLPVHLCARCLFVVHFLPLGIISLDGRLTVFQSGCAELSYELVRDIVCEIQGRILAGNYETIGTKEGSRAATRRLLSLFSRFQGDCRLSAITAGTTIHIWLFSNSGSSPSCEIQEIPNRTLMFLWVAVQRGLRQELEKLIETEQKKEYPLLRCIVQGRDYARLYPRGKWAGASRELFSLYQTEVCGRSSRALAAAWELAQQANSQKSVKELDRLKREEALREPQVRNQFRRFMVDLALLRQFTHDDYLELFPIVQDESGLSVGGDGWNIIRYYLHHADDPVQLAVDSSQSSNSSSRTAPIRYYAALIMRTHLKNRGGSDAFRCEVLNRLASAKIGHAWLCAQFVHLAELHRGFTYAVWEHFCRNTDEFSSVSEFLFQMRLLWSEWLGDPEVPNIAHPELHSGTGLPAAIENRLEQVFALYVGRRGLHRFHSDVLMRLRRGELSLSWLKQQFLAADRAIPPLLEADWENLIVSDTGQSCASKRQFQMHLMLSNLYRECNAERT